MTVFQDFGSLMRNRKELRYLMGRATEKGGFQSQ